MKTVMFALTLFVSLSAMAQVSFQPLRWGGGYPDYPNYPGHGGQGRVTCSVHDSGWEEHWGGHGSCDECLTKHGSCVETCSEEAFRCTVEGTPSNAPQGYRETYYGSGGSRWEAEDEAMRSCQWRGYNCVSRGCESETREVSETNCR